MIIVAGGVYLERCIQPHWSQLYGSGGRAAAALTSLTEVELRTYIDDAERRDLEVRAKSFGRMALHAERVQSTVRFDYMHSLSTPVITPAPHVLVRAPAISAEGDVVLRFGMIEGDAVVRGCRVIYDPQSAFNPQFFSANGSTAEHLAIVANSYEIRMLTGENDVETGARRLLDREKAEVVVVKQGSRGALVLTATTLEAVPAYKGELVFSIGSGDIFAAAFAYFWGEAKLAPELAADLASRSTARYCETRSPLLLKQRDLEATMLLPVSSTTGRVYLAGPFFTIAQRWLVEEARAHLRGMGQGVFSPLHDVGRGSADEVAPADLAGIDACDRMLALVDGADPGTLFEVGYARARGLPVVALAESLPQEDMKMIVGSGCKYTDDFVTAIYSTCWIR
ncbi:PfkB family carbohydrate kinase [Sorangium sp. So ce429]